MRRLHRAGELSRQACHGQITDLLSSPLAKIIRSRLTDDEAIHCFIARWMASLLLAMTVLAV
jgi:hypothetical protein